MEVDCHAFPQLVEELWCVLVKEALVVDNDVGEQRDGKAACAWSSIPCCSNR